jgi:DNA-binding PadR family transcriptional regulator
MAKPNIDPDQFLPLTPAVFHILLALADGERHGYAIMQGVAETTEGQIKMGPGTLYGTIKRLVESKLIEECEDRPDPELDDERRRYYRLTALGRRVGEAEALRYSKLVRAARSKRFIRQVANQIIWEDC